MAFPWLKSTFQLGCISSLGSGVESVSLPFLASRARLHSFLHLQSQSPRIFKFLPQVPFIRTLGQPSLLNNPLSLLHCYIMFIIQQAFINAWIFILFFLFFQLFTPLLLKVWPPGQWQQHHWVACLEAKSQASSQDLNQALQLTRSLEDFYAHESLRSTILPFTFEIFITTVF